MKKLERNNNFIKTQNCCYKFTLGIIAFNYNGHTVHTSQLLIGHSFSFIESTLMTFYFFFHAQTASTFTYIHAQTFKKHKHTHEDTLQVL